MAVRPLSVQQINGLRNNPDNYESHSKTISKVNELIASKVGTNLTSKAVMLSSGMGTPTSATLTGSVKRGVVTATAGTSGLVANPTITVNFPSGEFDSVPFAQVSRSGGTGTLGYSYTVTQNQLIITLTGTPLASETYTFSYMVVD